MRILFLSSVLPYPPVGGDRIRAYNLIKQLQKGHSVSVLSFIKFDDEKRYARQLEEFCEAVETVTISRQKRYSNCILHLFSKVPFIVSSLYSEKMRQRIIELVSRDLFDMIYVYQIRVADYMESGLRIPRILDLTDSALLNFRRRLNFQRDWSWPLVLYEYFKLKKYEPQIIQKFDLCTVVSSVDRNAINVYQPKANIRVIPNGVDCSYFLPMNGSYDNRNIVFLGTMCYPPNVDAVLYLCRDILPRIHKALPEARVYIVGTDPVRRVKALSKYNNVFITGFVTDVRPYLAKAAVLLCPLRIASGTQLKILEAMAMGVPVVTSPLGLEGIGAIPDENIMVGEDAEELARKTVMLLTDTVLRNEVGLRGRQLVTEKYTWERIGQELELILREVVSAEGSKKL